MTRLPGAVVLAALLLAPGAASAAKCPPQTSPTRKIPAGGGKAIVLPRPACVDRKIEREAPEKGKAIPLPPRCRGSRVPAYKNGAWRCVPGR